MAQKQYSIRKATLEEQIADLQVRVACLEVTRLADTVRAQAGWIEKLEERVRKLEEKKDGTKAV